MSEDSGDREEEPQRNFFIDLTGKELDSYEGQNYIILQCQQFISANVASEADMNAIYMLKELVKVKRNIDVLRLRRDVDKLKEVMGVSKS